MTRATSRRKITTSSIHDGSTTTVDMEDRCDQNDDEDNDETYDIDDLIYNKYCFILPTTATSSFYYYYYNDNNRMLIHKEHQKV